MKLGGINMDNLEQTVETSFLNKVRTGLNRVKQSTFNKIAIYSLAGVLGAGIGYGCDGDAGSNGTNTPNSSARYACINDQCVEDPNGPYAISNCGGICVGTIEDNKLYRCVDNKCIEDPNGLYAISDCENKCLEMADKKCWEGTFGGSDYDEIFSIQQTNDGGYIAVGDYTDVDNEIYQAWVFKLDSNGNLVWDNYFGEYDYGATSIQKIKNDEFVIAGYASDDAWVLKLNSNGNVVWEKQFGGLWYDWANSIQQTTDEGYIVAGVKDFVGDSGKGDGWFFKLDSDGELEWEKTFGDTSKSLWEKTSEGSSDDTANSIQQTKDGGYIVAGQTELKDEVLGKDCEYYDSCKYFMNYEAWILKLDSNGELEWDKIFGNKKFDDAVYSILQIKDGGYIAAGYTNVDNECLSNPEPAWIIKLDSKGEIEWDKKYGENGCALYRALSIQQTTDLGYIVAGNKSNDGLVFKVDSKGNLDWEIIFDGTGLWSGDSVNSIQQTSEGGYIAAGVTSAKGAGGSDGWVLKFDKDGKCE